MFKHLAQDTTSTKNLVKSSVQRGIRAKLLEAFPKLEPFIDEFLPKKSALSIVKVPNHGTLVLNAEGKPVLFQIRDGPWSPTLRVLMQYNNVLPTMQCDYGAIKFVLRGSNIMCPGLTSPGGKMEDVPSGTVVQVVGEGKTSPCAIGITTMSTAEIREVNKGVCIETWHVLGDGLWTTETF